MKNTIIFLLLLIPFFSISQKKKSQKQTMEEQVAIAKKQAELAAMKPLAKPGAKLPAFKVLDNEKKIITEKDIDPNHPLVIVLFNPGCDHCMMATKDFYENKDRFGGSTILFITGDQLWQQLASFMRFINLDLSKAPHFIISADQSNVTKDLFEAKGIPQVMVYNKEKVLQKVFHQFITIDSVLNYLSN